MRKSLPKDIPELLMRKPVWNCQRLEDEPVSPVIGNLSEPVHYVLQVKQGGTARDYYSRPYAIGVGSFLFSCATMCVKW